jgi:hypothetical protein
LACFLVQSNRVGFEDGVGFGAGQKFSIPLGDALPRGSITKRIFFTAINARCRAETLTFRYYETKTST